MIIKLSALNLFVKLKNAGKAREQKRSENNLVIIFFAIFTHFSLTFQTPAVLNIKLNILHNILNAKNLS